ncbi:MAG TPA: flippase-like domain-containing protein [Firmicutes bacterium]|nr:flippase-like domain-containing protein [Bacillota bacterium]
MNRGSQISKYKIIAGTVAAIGITLFAFWMVYRQIPDKSRLQELLARVNWFYVTLALLLTSASWVADTARLWVICRSIGYRPRFLRLLAGILAGNFLTLSTPFLAGGAPAVVYALYLEGLSWADATATLLVGGLASQLALGSCAFAALNGLLSLAVPPKWIGPFVLFIPGYIVFMTSLALLAYFYDRYEYRAKALLRKLPRSSSVMKWLRDLNTSFRRILGPNKPAFAVAFLFGIVYFLLFFAVAPVCLQALGIRRTWWKIMALQALIHTVAGITPTPGGSGTSELGVFYLFNRVLAPSVIGAYLLLWRGVTFFFNLAMGLIGLLFLVSWGAWR